jgi:Zn-finger nucleic acid-binding protein
MSDGLTFECPHCNRTVQVNKSSLGETVDCPHCEGSFQTQHPLGRPLDTEDVGQTAAAPTEKVLQQMHPVVFRNHLWTTSLFLLVGLAGLAGTVMWLSGAGVLGLEGTVLLAVSLAGLALAAVYCAVRAVQAAVVTLTVTSVRTIVKRGLLSRRTNELQHDDIRNIRCEQNILERLFNYGDISLSSSGQADMEIVIEDVPNPQKMIALIRERQ